MGRRNKPKSPEQIQAEKAERRRQDFEAVNLDPASAALRAFEDVQIERQGRKSDRNRAWRSNIFRLLLERKTITTSHYEAAYQLVGDWAAWKGLDGKPETFGEFVDGGSGSAELVTDRMIKAGKRVKYALSAVEPMSMVILEAFMVATVEEDRPMMWRGIMERIGVKAERKQTEAVVTALEQLRVHYQEPGRVAA